MVDELKSSYQQEFLLESIRKVPELVETKKQMTNQIEKEENEISEKNKIFSTQEEKIKSMEIESKGKFHINVKRTLRYGKVPFYRGQHIRLKHLFRSETH